VQCTIWVVPATSPDLALQKQKWKKKIGLDDCWMDGWMDGYFPSFFTTFHITTLIQNVAVFTIFLIKPFNPECATWWHFSPFSSSLLLIWNVQHGSIFYHFPHHSF
jgi:hypothetical protein